MCATVTIECNGMAWLCGGQDAINSLVRSYGDKYRPKRVIIVVEVENETTFQMATLMGVSIVAWAPSIRLLLKPLPLSLLYSFILLDQVHASFVLRLVERDKFSVLCLNAGGFTLSAGELTELMRRNVQPEKKLTEKSFSMESIKMKRLFAQIPKRLPQMIDVPSLDVIQCSDLKFICIVNSNSIVEYIQMCANMFSLQVKFVRGHNDKTATTPAAWPVNWTAQEELLKSRLENYHRDSTPNQAEVMFSLSDDGEQLAAAIIDKKQNLYILSDADVSTLLIWWTGQMRQFEVEYSKFRAANPTAETETGGAIVPNTNVVIVGKAYPVSGATEATARRLFKETNAKVLVFERTDQVLAAVRNQFESAGSTLPKFVLAVDSRRRYLYSGSPTWDAVVVAVQLAQIAIYAKAISRCTLRQLLDRLRLDQQAMT